MRKIGAKNKNFFDIIIDDGSHKLGDILICLNTFIQNLNSNGVYIIEDFKLQIITHLNDVNEYKIDELCQKIQQRENIISEILNAETISMLQKILLLKRIRET